MLELMLDRHVIYVLMGMSAFAGVVSKVVVGRTKHSLPSRLTGKNFISVQLKQKHCLTSLIR